MSSSRGQLHAAVSLFSGELQAFAGRVTDSVNTLKRTVDHRPHAGAQDFRECLDDLEQQVADLTEETEQLERFAVESISFEELLGHCTAVYSSNRGSIQALEQHLQQYGYAAPLDAVQEPEDPLSLLRGSDAAEELDALPDGLLLDYEDSWATATKAPCSSTLKGAQVAPMSVRRPLAPLRSAPTSPSQELLNVDQGNYVTAIKQGYMPSRLGPGSPLPLKGMTAHKGPLRQEDAGPSARAGVYAAATHTASAFRGTRPSMDSRASSTPDPLLLSPGMAALAEKYAETSSSSQLSLPPSLPSGSLQPPSLPKRTPRRDLNRHWDDTTDGSAASTASLSHWAGQGQAGLLGTESAGDTGELYSSVIHTSMEPQQQQQPRLQEQASDGEQENRQPSSRATTPGRCRTPSLPPAWHQQKLQELDDMHLTLSAIKSNALASRLDNLGLSDSDGEGGQQQQERQSRSARSGRSSRRRSVGRRARSSLGERFAAAAAEDANERRDQDSGGSGRDAVKVPADTVNSRRDAVKAPAAAVSLEIGERAGNAALLSVFPVNQQRHQRQQQQQQEQSRQASLDTPGCDSTRRTRSSALKQQHQQQHAALQAQAADQEPCCAAAPMAAVIAAEEYGTLPAWCTNQVGLLDLNSVVEQLNVLIKDRWQAGSGDARFSVHDVQQLGHGAAKSRTILNVLHKLKRASVESTAAGSLYRLCGAAAV